jgi:polysaccharide export outer membrane protein
MPFSTARRACLAVTTALAILVGSDWVLAGENDYTIGPQDVLSVSVYGQPTLTGRYSVQADGTFGFPLIGRIRAAGLTVDAVEKEIGDRLSDRFVKDPRVTVSVDEYRSQRIFVMGEVRQPGAYPLNRETTLLEVLARAGSATPDASGEVLLVRPSGAVTVSQPTLPDQTPGSNVVKIDLKDLQTGKLQNLATLRDGDTVFVPRGERIYILGHVRSPGAYTLQRNMTVLEALATAGGATDRGATNRLKVSRTVGGKTREVNVKLTDLVQAGDTIIVPERYF